MKTIICTFSAAALFVSAFYAVAEDAGKSTRNGAVEITAAELWKKLKEEWKGENRPVLIDLRSAEEYGSGHVAKARRLDPGADDFDSKIAGLDRKLTYVVYCKDGTVSAKVVAGWKDQNFPNLYLLTGGWEAYEAFISGGR